MLNHRRVQLTLSTEAFQQTTQSLLKDKTFSYFEKACCNMPYKVFRFGFLSMFLLNHTQGGRCSFFLHDFYQFSTEKILEALFLYNLVATCTKSIHKDLFFANFGHFQPKAYWMHFFRSKAFFIFPAPPPRGF